MTRILDNSGIDEIMQEFDFYRVEKAMQKMDWKWFGKGVPNQEQLKDTAKMLLDRCKAGVWNTLNNKGKKKAICLTGTDGFEAAAEVFKDSDKVYYSLKFVVSTWSNYE